MNFAAPHGGLTIRPAGRDDLPSFFAYLHDHMRDNGTGGTPLFMPMPRSASFLPPEKEAAFRAALDAPMGKPGWRRAWIAIDADDNIAGHIDLRSRPASACGHRALLGMGVHRDYRQQGLGAALIDVAAGWAGNEGLAWIDLEVLSANHAARALYRRCGFEQVGEMDDMFRIDGEQLGYTFMARRLAPPA